MIKRCLVNFMYVVFLMYIAGCGAAANKSVIMNDENADIRIYEVFGMDCPACASGLDKLVVKIPAIRESEAQWKVKRLVISVKDGEQLQDEDIYDAIERANFTPGKRIK